MSGRTRLDPLLSPRSVAIIGASERGHHGKRAADNLRSMGYGKPIYLINPSRKEVWGQPCYPSVTDTPTVPELAVLVVNRERVLEIVKQCAAAGVQALTINTDGFSESVDSQGLKLQRELAALIRDTGLLLCGPNCLGAINRHAEVAPFCGPIRNPIRRGGLSFISQSGGNCSSFMGLAFARNIGMSYVISSGNEVGLDVCDYLEHIVDDTNTSVVCLFIESIRNPDRFLDLSIKATRMGKPIVAIKIGKSEAARTVALAHTGAFAGSDQAVATLFERGGIVRCSSLEEAIDKCSLFSLVPKQRWPRGGRIAVFTVGGGLAGLVSDLSPERGLELPALPHSVKEVVQSGIPSTIRLQNPLDIPGVYLTDQSDIAATYVRECAKSPAYDAVLVLRPMPGPQSLDYLSDLRGIPEDTGKPVIVSSPVESSLEDYKRAIMENSDLTLVTGLRRTLDGLHAVIEFKSAQENVHERVLCEASPLPTTTRTALTRHIEESRHVLAHSTTYDLIERFGLSVVPQKVVTEAPEAIEFANAIGYPVVAKLINSEAAIHKSELGAIHTNLMCSEDLARAIDQLSLVATRTGIAQSGRPLPMLIQKMVQPAFEMYLGATVPEGGYPPLVLVGAGGIYVETMRDVVRGIAPLTQAEALALITRLKSYPILTGLRGRPPFDVKVLADSLVKLGNMIMAVRDFVKDVDLNPVMVRNEGGGALVVDAVFTLRQNEVARAA